MNPREKKLLNRFRELPEAERDTLLAFAEFLAERREPQIPREIPKPDAIPAKENESVVGALKRLSSSYHMLDKAKMLNETSALVAQHVMQGRERGEVIEELELVFERHYRALVGGDD